MTIRNQFLFWVCFSFISFLVLYFLSPILLPFVAGMAVAYFLDPVADKLEALGCGRMVATILILVAFIILLVLILILIVPLLSHQLTGLLQRLPDVVAALQERLSSLTFSNLGSIVGFSEKEMLDGVKSVVADGARWIGVVLHSLVNSGQAILSLLSLFVITPVVAFYLLYDWDHMIERIDSWLPRDHVSTLRMLAKQMDDTVAGFVRGQTLVATIIGCFYAICLTIVGLNFGILIGITAGLLGIIPYVGSTAGLLISLAVASFQFWPEWHWIVVVAGIFAVGQFIEGNILSPYMIGSRVRLHPVWLIFALFAFGYLFGFVGLLIAVPVAAMIGVLTRFMLGQYLSSNLYAGQSGEVRDGTEDETETEDQ